MCAAFRLKPGLQTHRGMRSPFEQELADVVPPLGGPRLFAKHASLTLVHSQMCAARRLTTPSLISLPRSVALRSVTATEQVLTALRSAPDSLEPPASEPFRKARGSALGQTSAAHRRAPGFATALVPGPRLVGSSLRFCVPLRRAHRAPPRVCQTSSPAPPLPDSRGAMPGMLRRPAG